MRMATKALVTCTAAACVGTLPDASAASIAVDADVTIVDTAAGENGNYNLSVFNNAFSYTTVWTGTNAGSTTVTAADAIVDYRFFKAPHDGNGPTTAATAGGLSTEGLTTDTSLVARNNARLWTTTNPTNVEIWDTTPNFNGSGVGLKALQADFTMSFDISGLASGTVYLIHGIINGSSALSLTMVDTDGSESDIVSDAVNTPDINGQHKISSFDFVNDAGYDRIDLTLDVAGGPAILVGSVVTGVVPEPGSLALMALGGLCVLRRRRA